MKLRSALLVATVLVAPIAAKAQPVTGLYVGAGAGFNYLDNPDVERITPFTPANLNLASGNGSNYTKGTLTTTGGAVGVTSIGFGLGNGLRFELEGDYRYSHYKLRHVGPLSGGGDIQTYGPMINVLYDFNIANFPVTPYVGVGGGYQFSSQQRARVYTTGGVVGTLPLSTDNYGSAAAQAIFGVAYNIRAVPGLALTAEYRFLATVESEKFKGHAFIAGVGVGGGTEKIGDQFNHAALFGVRYNFGVGAPPPPPAQAIVPSAAVPARSYLVFFDWDRADLTARARQIIAEAASTSTKVSYTKIQVSGNADRSGTPQYNQRLSLRRAENVAAELVKDGVPRTAIDIQAFGDTRPLVPTAAGVREPQNRRVEIVLQ